MPHDEMVIPVVDLRIARYVMTIAQCGGMRAAARMLYVSESALSQAIHDTEQRWGIPLFLRRGRQLTLTPEGEALLPWIQKVLEASAELSRQIASVRAARSQRCRVGVVAFTVWGVSAVLPSLLQQHPTLNLELYESSTSGILEKAREGSVDLGFVLNSPLCPLDTQALDARTVCAGKLIALAGLRSRWSRCRALPREAFRAIPIVGFPRGYYICDLLAAVFGQRIHDQMIYVVESADQQFLPVKLGKGVLLMPDFTAHFTPYAQRFHMMDIQPPIPVHLQTVRPINASAFPHIGDELETLLAHYLETHQIGMPTTSE